MVLVGEFIRFHLPFYPTQNSQLQSPTQKPQRQPTQNFHSIVSLPLSYLFIDFNYFNELIKFFFGIQHITGHFGSQFDIIVTLHSEVEHRDGCFYIRFHILSVVYGVITHLNSVLIFSTQQFVNFSSQLGDDTMCCERSGSEVHPTSFYMGEVTVVERFQLSSQITSAHYSKSVHIGGGVNTHYIVNIQKRLE
jgi:hypothetical protein